MFYFHIWSAAIIIFLNTIIRNLITWNFFCKTENAIVLLDTTGNSLVLPPHCETAPIYLT